MIDLPRARLLSGRRQPSANWPEKCDQRRRFLSFFSRHSEIFHTDLAEKHPFSVFSDTFPGSEMQAHLVSPCTGLHKIATFSTQIVGLKSGLLDSSHVLDHQRRSRHLKRKGAFPFRARVFVRPCRKNFLNKKSCLSRNHLGGIQKLNLFYNALPGRLICANSAMQL
jgi:hypothetical protein